jgi:hypothetical protein
MSGPTFVEASGSRVFAPGQLVYPDANVDAHLIMATYGYHFTAPMLNRPSMASVNVLGGSIDADVATNIPPALLPPGVPPGTSFSESSSGFSDPNAQVVINVFGTPPLRSGVDLLNYEPSWTADIAGLVAFPIGSYDDKNLVNIGQNRWYGRLALPLKYHLRVFSPGLMSSVELIPSVWLFGENDDFLGQKLENDPLWSIEAHYTHDFTPSFYGSLDLLYQSGFRSELNGVDVGSKLEIGNIGFSLNYFVSDNAGIRTSLSSNLFGNNGLDTFFARIQFVYAWHPASENMKRLRQGH